VIDDDEDEQRRRLHCLDCGVNTAEIGEYYMLRDELWAATGVAPDGWMLCVACAEKRLGRRLVPTTSSTWR
jgi:hypothetical protein